MHSHTTVIGHIGQDAQTKTLDNGRVVTQFSVAHTENWKDNKGEKQQRTTWVNCSYFTTDVPGVSAYLLKGSIVCVTGKVSARAYLLANGQPAASLDINVDNIRLISMPKREEATPLPHPDTVMPSTATTGADAAEGDDLPF